VKLSLDARDLPGYIARQLSGILPDRDVAPADLAPLVAQALERAEYCFSRIRLKFFWEGDQVIFNHLHTDQYAAFLYLLSNSLYRGGRRDLAARVYVLNKALHGLDAYFEVELPKVFAFQHPLGTVLGRGTYGERFFCYQRCSVGSSVDGAYPVIGSGVVMYGGSAIIGDCHIGDNALLSVNAVVMDADVPPGSVVFGSRPNLVIKATARRVADSIFRDA
jgi:serine O-acetyltransferase